MSDRTESTAGGSEGRTWLESPPLPSMPGIGSYFSLRATLEILLGLGAGLLVGGFLLPTAGGMIGLAVVALAIGVVGSRRRYTEVLVASTAVGGVSVFFNHALLAAGSGQSFAGIGLSTGVMLSIVGYSVGRRLGTRIEAA